jgi:ferric-dicitrate binding protein FerR (iron transport regulator)
MKNTEKIYTLISKYISGELSADEREALNKWRDESPENKNILEEMKKIWELTLPEDSMVNKKSPDEEWCRLQKNLALGKTNRVPFFEKFNWKWYMSAAATFLIVFGAGFWFTQNNKPILEVVETQNKEIREFYLSDGSHIKMNHASQLRYGAFNGDSIRFVVLKGEAFFTVAKNEKPFVVQTANSRIRVLGTAFNIWARGDETRALVYEGKVSLQNSASSSEKVKKVQLGKNQLAIAKNSQIQIRNSQRSSHFPAWLQGEIVFNGTRLQEAVKELEFGFDCQIKLKEPHLGGLLITANFRQKSLENILEAICLALNLNYSKESGIYILFSNPN